MCLLAQPLFPLLKEAARFSFWITACFYSTSVLGFLCVWTCDLDLHSKAFQISGHSTEMKTHTQAVRDFPWLCCIHLRKGIPSVTPLQLLRRVNRMLLGNTKQWSLKSGSRRRQTLIIVLSNTMGLLDKLSLTREVW